MCFFIQHCTSLNTFGLFRGTLLVGICFAYFESPLKLNLIILASYSMHIKRTIYLQRYSRWRRYRPETTYKKKIKVALQNSPVPDLHNLTTRLAGKETTMFIIR